jgi:integrase
MVEGGDGPESVRIIRASRKGAFVPGPIPSPSEATPEGFLMLFTADLHPVEAANRFMMDVCYRPIKSSRWQNSQRASAQDLAQWWTYLGVNGIEWDRARPEDIEEYANRMAEAVSPVTSLQFSTSTVRRRVGSVETFYARARREGLIAKPLDQGQEKAGVPIGPGAAFLPHLGTATIPKQGRRRPRGRDPEKDPRPFRLKDLAAVLSRLAPPIFAPDQSLLPWESGTASRRNRLMAEVAYHTGMRGDEVASISVWDVLDKARRLSSSTKWQQFKLNVRTKGRASRDVVVSSVVLRALVLYHDVERAEAIQRALQAVEAAGRSFRAPTELFVNGVDANLRDIGRPVSAETPSRAFTKAVLAEGLTVVREGFELDPDTSDLVFGEDGKAVLREIVGAAHTFHDLRHTFAVLFYKSEVNRGNPAPWEKLRSLLGHASAETTKNIYLRHIDVDEASISDATAHRLRMDLHAYR